MLMLMVLVSITGVMSMAGRIEQTVLLTTETDQKASAAMNRMILEVREAKEISTPSNHQLRVFYPVMRADGHYDRFVTDYGSWVQYSLAREDGTPTPAGSYLWRTSSAGGNRVLTADVKRFRVQQNSAKSVRLTLELEKTAGSRKGSTKLTERVLYLRNN